MVEKRWWAVGSHGLADCIRIVQYFQYLLEGWFFLNCFDILCLVFRFIFFSLPPPPFFDF